MSKKVSVKQMMIKRKALQRQKRRKKNALERKNELIKKRNETIVAEIRSSEESEAVTPTFDRSLWESSSTALVVSSPSVLEKDSTTKMGSFDADAWKPPRM